LLVVLPFSDSTTYKYPASRPSFFIHPISNNNYSSSFLLGIIAPPTSSYRSRHSSSSVVVQLAALLTLSIMLATAAAVATRAIKEVVQPIRTYEGAGFPVYRPRSMPDPFLMLDEFGPIEYGPGEAKGGMYLCS
jgi:hypothetical protein